MTDGLLKASVVGVLALAAAGCGSSSTSSNPATTAPTTHAASVPTRTAARHKAPAKQPRSEPKQRTTTTVATTTPTATAVPTAPPQAPAGTPAAPDGLRPTSGYSTYENCAGDCTGAVPSSLRRALHLPTASSGCPVSGGTGPVHTHAARGFSPFIGSAWLGARVSWTAARSYSGPILIRGRQLAGPNAVGFGEGHVPYDELQLRAGASRSWPSFTRVRSKGCYGYQVDGTSFSEVIVFSSS
jgi:hypothetical protein